MNRLIDGLILGFALVLAICLFGCAVTSQRAKTTSTSTNGVVTVQDAKCITYTLFDGNATVDKARASAGKTTSAGATGTAESSSTGNLATNLTAAAALINSLKSP